MKVIDLFSGCGGMSLGFQEAGFEIIQAFDNWDPAIKIYEKNFAHSISEMDLSATDDFELFKNYNADIIIGGPPCQDFSSAGKRQESDRADLTIKFAEIVTHTKPMFFVMENVERITTTKTLQKVLNIFKMNDYGLSARVLDASLCGVPQIRKRYFLIGELGGKDDVISAYLDKNLANRPMTIFDYLGNSLGVEHYYRHPRSYARRGVFSIHEPSPTIRGVNRPVPPKYQFHAGDSTKEIVGLRALSSLERSYIQTFPKTFLWDGISKSDMEQIIGNAVPVKLAQYVASCLLEYINDTKKGISALNLVGKQISIF